MSGFGHMDLVWKQAGVQESSGLLLANTFQPIRTRRELDPACLLGLVSQQDTSAVVGILFLATAQEHWESPGH